MLREADPTVLRVLAREIYPALREDPTNPSWRGPIAWEPEWFFYRAELPGGRLVVTDRVLEGEGVILIGAIDLIPHQLRTIPEPPRQSSRFHAPPMRELLAGHGSRVGSRGLNAAAWRYGS